MVIGVEEKSGGNLAEWNFFVNLVRKRQVFVGSNINAKANEAKK